MHHGPSACSFLSGLTSYSGTTFKVNIKYWHDLFLGSNTGTTFIKGSDTGTTSAFLLRWHFLFFPPPLGCHLVLSKITLGIPFLLRQAATARPEGPAPTMTGPSTLTTSSSTSSLYLLKGSWEVLYSVSPQPSIDGWTGTRDGGEERSSLCFSFSLFLRRLQLCFFASLEKRKKEKRERGKEVLSLEKGFRGCLILGRLVTQLRKTTFLSLLTWILNT